MCIPLNSQLCVTVSSVSLLQVDRAEEKGDVEAELVDGEALQLMTHSFTSLAMKEFDSFCEGDGFALGPLPSPRESFRLGSPVLPGGRLGHHTSANFIVHALTSHSLWATPRTSSSINIPSVVIRRIRPSVTFPWPETSCEMGVRVKALLKEKTPLMMILSGSLVEYGPRVVGGGVVLAVLTEGAYEDSEYIDAAELAL